MARTKQTARREGTSPNIASKAASHKGKRKQGKPMHILKHACKRRLNRTIHMFSEIRKAQKYMELCTPKLPFQRLVREICESFSQGHKRWKVCALLAVQEASEDFIMEYFNDLTEVEAHARRVTIMDKDFDTVKCMRWRYDKLLQPSEFVDKKMRELLVIPPTRKEEADALKIRDVTHEVQTRAKAAYTELMDQRQKQINQNRSTIQLYTDNYLSRYRACIISDILEVSQAKTPDNARMFPDIGNIELMLAFGECGVPKEVTVEEREEHKATENVQENPMEEMECTREEAEETVPIVEEDVPAAKPAIEAEVPCNTMEELKQTTEEPKVEISPKATDNVASNEHANILEEIRETKEQSELEIPSVQTHNMASNDLATSMEGVGTTREEPNLGLPPMAEHMPQDISAGQEHPVTGTVAEEPTQSKQELGESKKEELEVESEHMPQDILVGQAHPIARTVAEEPAQSKQEEGESKKEELEVESETRHSPKDPEHINKEDEQD
ncbi:hypothetical protein L7F22_017360 [Adiantum nelumboides]|nr:hypothetical protein [Adiantum nelumboides]